MSNDNRDAQALDYDPLYDKSQYVKDYKEIKSKGKREGYPDVQPHHIRGLNNYHRGFSHLTPENRYILQAELEPYGLQFGNTKDNLVAAEGQWSKSKPGETRYGGQHGQLHSEQESAMQKELGVDRFKGSYTGVAGVPWAEMSQEQIMGFLRNMAIKDEMTMNKTLSTALPISKSPPAIQQLQQQVQKVIGFGNRLVNRADAVNTAFEMQGSSIDEARQISNNTVKRREEAASIAKNNGGLNGMPDLGISETLAGKSLVQDERQKVLADKPKSQGAGLLNEMMYMKNRLMGLRLPYMPF